jgi:hypothetical protein
MEQGHILSGKYTVKLKHLISLNENNGKEGTAGTTDVITSTSLFRKRSATLKFCTQAAPSNTRHALRRKLQRKRTYRFYQSVLKLWVNTENAFHNSISTSNNFNKVSSIADKGAKSDTATSIEEIRRC